MANLSARRLRGDRGEVGITLMVFPLVILAFYCALHAALVFHGRQVVAAAAQDGLRAAQLEGGDAAEARRAAQNILSISPGLANTSVVITGAESDDITVEVSATVQTPLLGMFTSVSHTSTGPKERFYSEFERN